MLYYCLPVVEHVDDRRCVIRIPLRRRTRNHLNCMYFGVLSVGADCTAGLIAMNAVRKSGKNVSLLFKDFKADFCKRAEGDVWFFCEQGEAILDMVAKAMAGSERINMPVEVIAKVPDKTGDEPVARFELTLSLKNRSGAESQSG